MDLALRQWDEAIARVDDILYVPYRTTPLNEVLEHEGLENVLPGNQPIDHSLGEIQNAAFVAHRELVNHVSGRETNRALLINSLARIQRASVLYRDIRASLDMGDPSNIDWAEELCVVARQLREALETFTLPDIGRQYKAEAHRFVERFEDLRAIAADLLGRAQHAVSAGAIWSNGAAQVAALRQAVAESIPDFAGYEKYDRLIFAADVLTALSEQLTCMPTREATSLEPARRAVDSLSDLDPVAAEVWLARRAWWSRTSQGEAEASAALWELGIEAAYTVFPSLLDNPMWRTAAVVVRVGDLQEVGAIRDAIMDSAFTHLPDDVQQLSLLISHRDAMVIPIAYQLWRTTYLEGTLYSLLSHGSRWLLHLDLEPLAKQLQVSIDQRTHPVARCIAALREEMARLALGAAHLGALVSAVFEQVWTIRGDAIAAQVRKVASFVASLGERIGELDRQNDEYSLSWETTIQFSLAIVGEFLHWFVDVMRGMSTGVDLDTLHQSFADIDMCVNNLLYLGVDSAESRLSSLGAVDVDGWYQAARAVLVDLENELPT